jgi:hypothetical protein
MKIKFTFLLLSGLLAALALAGCQGLPTAQSAVAQSSSPTAAPSPTALPRPTLRPTATATSLPDPNAAPLEAAKNLATALEKGDSAAVANLISEFSLTYAGLTRGEAAAQLSKTLASYTFGETRLLDDSAALVGVTISPKDGDPARAETWVFRQENGRWLYNFGNLIDTHTLGVSDQTTGGVTLKPSILVRYSDRIRLELLAQNQTNDTIVLGQPNEILAQFSFGDKTVEAEAAKIVLEPLRSYPSIVLEVKGEFTSFPTTVDIRIWKNYKVAPWFHFDLTQ